MNLFKNIKKAAKIEKKVLFKKVFHKIKSKIYDCFWQRRDSRKSTYTYYSNLELLPIKIEIPQDIESNPKYCASISDDMIEIFGSKIKLETISKKHPFPDCKIDEEYSAVFDKVEKLYNFDKDYIGNFQWEANSWYKNISYGSVHGADIKVPWEIGRLQFLPPYILQCIQNNDTEAAGKFKEIVFSFMKSNPPRFGTQWMTSMDVGIRAVNLLISLSLLKQNNFIVFSTIEEAVLLSYIADHGLHIENNLEYSQGMRGNHYFANIVGVLACAIHLINYPNRESTIEHYTQELLNELQYQFNADGFNFEASVPYHFFVFEMLEYAYKLLNNYGIEHHTKSKLNKEYSKIKNATEKLVAYGKLIPQIGDNDSGYLYNLYPTFDIDTIKEKYTANTFDTNTKTESFLFENSGLYINQKAPYYFIMRCGEVGQKGKGGHDHNDHTSFELYVKGKPFIVDPGTYNYTAYHGERNNYRSAYMHNTFLPVNREQNLFETGSKDDLFWLSEIRTQSEIIDYSDSEVTATHKAFHAVCMRKIHFEENTINISDTIEISCNKTLRLFLHPDVRVKSEKCCFILDNNGTNIRIKCINKGEIKDYYYSKGYLQKEKSLYLEFATHEKNIEWIIEIVK